jgi:hypothetical protein
MATSVPVPSPQTLASSQSRVRELKQLNRALRAEMAVLGVALEDDERAEQLRAAEREKAEKAKRLEKQQAEQHAAMVQQVVQSLQLLRDARKEPRVAKFLSKEVQSAADELERTAIELGILEGATPPVAPSTPSTSARHELFGLIRPSSSLSSSSSSSSSDDEDRAGVVLPSARSWIERAVAAGVPPPKRRDGGVAVSSAMLESLARDTERVLRSADEAMLTAGAVAEADVVGEDRVRRYRDAQKQRQRDELMRTRVPRPEL